MQVDHRRFPVENCTRLTAGALRRCVAAGAVSYVTRSGEVLELRWSGCRGCFGNGEGLALAFACPVCDRTCRVLWRPPGCSWGCWRCRPVSHRSHRRSGAGKGSPKPASWRLAQLSDAQSRVAGIVGLMEWPPSQILWTWKDLEKAPLRPDAPRLSHRRRQTLLQRLECLEALRLAVIAGGIQTDQEALRGYLPGWPELGKLAQAAVIGERLSRWALRRGRHDPRTTRNWQLQAASSA